MSSDKTQKTGKETIFIRYRDAFLGYNEERKRRALDIMSKEKKWIFSSLPFLLHTNHPDFPGYVSSIYTPYGIYNFQLKKSDVDSLKALFSKSIILKKDIIKKVPPELSPPELLIESLLLMGSVGSIAHTKDSDYDYWVCIEQEKFTAETLKLLNTKLDLIQSWALSTYDMEINFFIMDLAHARIDDFGGVDKESAGSSQAKLLKEEFYRTLILHAGKIPLWWVMPVGITDEEYTKKKILFNSFTQLDSADFVDLGNLSNISTTEFFGAALWQINKAMLSPFKSVLKMALLEMFLDTSIKKHDLLSDLLKKRVHDLCKNEKQIDPYAIMLDRITEYTKQKGRNDEALLLKKCFYIKTGVKLVNDPVFRKQMSHKEKIVMEYIDEWNWSDSLIGRLNDYKEWNFTTVLALGKEVHKFLRESYIRLSDKLKEEDEIKQKITDIDRTILGRKLFTMYFKQPHKVHFLERAFEEGICQESLTFYAAYTKSGHIFWRLYRGHLSKNDLQAPSSEDVLIKSSRQILDILIWLVHNRICDENTSFYLLLNPTPIALPSIQKLIGELRRFFPHKDISCLDSKALLENPKKIKFFIVLNFNGNSSEKDIEEITIFYETSWGEMFFEHFESKEGVQNLFEYMLEDSPRGAFVFDDYYQIFIPKGHFSNKIVFSLNNKLKEKLKKASYRH